MRQVMVQIMAHPTRIVTTQILLAVLLGATDEIATASDPPLLYFDASLPSATPEDHDAPEMYHLDIYYLS